MRSRRANAEIHREEAEVVTDYLLKSKLLSDSFEQGSSRRQILGGRPDLRSESANNLRPTRSSEVRLPVLCNSCSTSNSSFKYVFIGSSSDVA